MHRFNFFLLIQGIDNMKSSVICLTVFCILCVGPALADITSSTWTYAGAGDTDQSFWKDIPGSFCDGSSQSPINIVTKWTRDIEYTPFNLESYEDVTMDATVENNGHALEVEISGSDDTGYYDITGGGLTGTFRAYQFHFHFGSTGRQGSEHTIDGERYPAEMHIVHYDTAYDAPGSAIQHKGGIAVLGFFLEEDDEDNEALDNILDQVSHIVQPHTEEEIHDFTLSELLPSSLDKFWRYDGSLTTPLCNEVVTWTLFEDTIKISKSQLQTMRQLMSEAVDGDGNEMHMYDNYRDIQDRNLRTIYSVVTDDDEGDDGHIHPSPTDGAARPSPGMVTVIMAAFLTTFVFRL
ncbi:carbonic anhydrase 2-like [Lytechinus variegatus]|uniref:carbonic anhydrase 2-like n=1 Tax=Lytechinus variegatus TaxID=7654 RepID=UPI001BB14BD7|nr:carbonic anhydrase 2-like [Lytechinus variegatus]